MAVTDAVLVSTQSATLPYRQKHPKPLLRKAAGSALPTPDYWECYSIGSIDSAAKFKLLPPVLTQYYRTDDTVNFCAAAGYGKKNGRISPPIVESPAKKRAGGQSKAWSLPLIQMGSEACQVTAHGAAISARYPCLANASHSFPSSGAPSDQTGQAAKSPPTFSASASREEM